MPKGFKELDLSGIVRRLVMRVDGLTFSGKTHFGLTAPGPIAVLNTDNGLEGVAEKFVGEKEILVRDFRSMPSSTDRDYEARWDAYMESFNMLLEGHEVRSIMCDTDSEAWAYSRLSHFGRLTQVMPVQYTAPNLEFTRLFNRALLYDKNVILVCHKRKQYVQKEGSTKEVWNGKYEPSGFGGLPALVQVNLSASIVMDDGVPTPRLVVGKCRQNMSLMGEVFEGDMASFPFVASMVMDGTTPEDWE